MNKSKKGFTLIELMITVAIIGILSAIAMPKFNEYKERGELSRARSVMNRFEAVAFQFLSDNPNQLTELCNNKKVIKIELESSKNGEKFNCGPETTTIKVGDFILSFNLKAEMIQNPIDGNKPFVFLNVTKNTDSVPNGWQDNKSCWIVDKSGNC